MVTGRGGKESEELARSRRRRRGRVELGTYERYKESEQRKDDLTSWVAIYQVEENVDHGNNLDVKSKRRRNPSAHPSFIPPLPSDQSLKTHINQRSPPSPSTSRIMLQSIRKP